MPMMAASAAPDGRWRRRHWRENRPLHSALRRRRSPSTPRQPPAPSHAGGDPPAYPPSKPFDNGDIRHAAAFAHGLQAIALVALPEGMHQGGHQLGAGGAQRMTQRNRAAIDVEPRRI